MIDILYIAYQFPPLNVGGSARPAKFAKELRSNGINPIIVTLDPNDYDKVYENPKVDSNILSDFKENLSIIKVPSKNLLKHSKGRISKLFKILFNIYGNSEKKFWESNYHKAVDGYSKENEVSAIVVTAPPFGVLPLAMKTATKYKLPFIVDMRDPWTLWNVTPYSSYLTFIKTKLKERKIFNYASKIIATSKVTLEDMKALHPSIDPSKFEYIPNGYEGDIVTNKIVSKPEDKITIGYVGSFYYSPQSREMMFMNWWKKKGHRKLQYIFRKEDWLYRSPYIFFKTLRALFNMYPEFESKVQLKFAGKKEDWFQGMVEEFQLESNIEHLGWLSQNESISFQESCDFLLLTSAKVIDGKDYSIAGKTFEYFRMRKPILAFVAEGAQKDLLEESKQAYFVDVDSIEKGVEQLKTLLSESIVLEPNQAFIDSFNNKRLTQKFAGIIKEVLKKEG